jgi:uncharacterized protein
MAELSNKEFRDQYGEWALVLGAAEGIGEAFSETLAKKGMNLVMVDFNGEVLQDLSERLKKTYHIETREIIKDLSEKEGLEICMTAIPDLDCRLLVYIPAYSRVKEFLSTSHDELDKYIDLNSRTPLHLVHSFISLVKDKKSSGIILMSSLAGLIGTIYLAPYAATKAFNILLGESLSSEFRDSNIKISVCCAGQTSTPAYWSSKPVAGNNWPPILSSDQVADYALKKLGKKTIIIPGWQNRASFFILSRILPRSLAAKFVCRSMQKIYPGISSSNTTVDS